MSSSSNLQPPSATSTPRAKRGRPSVAPSSASSALSTSTPKRTLKAIPNIGRRTVVIDGHSLGRNGLVAEYILRRTGKSRSRSQIGSHIQILKKHNPDDQDLLALFNQPAIEGNDPLSLDFEAILGPRHPSTLAAIAAAASSAPPASAGLDPNVYLTKKGLLEQEILIDLDAPRASRRSSSRAPGTSERASSVATSEAGDVEPPKAKATPRAKAVAKDATPRKAAAPRRSTSKTPRKSSGLAVDGGAGTPARRSGRKSAVPPVPVLVVKGSHQAVEDAEGDAMDVDGAEKKEELVIGDQVLIATPLPETAAQDQQLVVAAETADAPVGWLGKAKGAFWSMVGY
ncbi:TEA/ATTS domain family-domain-containing protein [Leucosporidium creatinivorum]|uniref:TEA/ATTS domain family-domain-containing protein n=1 Tax=Leucosporidium creatinivorum TaxID=106004 RepID=A0A1Y2D5C1_9BASI|nr:TEA/ATTS domain family-domain-containing protein [Leucosporidium creatinivorum]